MSPGIGKLGRPPPQSHPFPFQPKLAFLQVPDPGSSLVRPPSRRPSVCTALTTTSFPILFHPWPTFEYELKCHLFREAFPDSSNEVNSLNETSPLNARSAGNKGGPRKRDTH